MGCQWHQCLLLIPLLNSAFFMQPSYSRHAHERLALLQFKQSFIINCSIASQSPFAKSIVMSWGDEGNPRNCCSWDSVSCDNDTGHVIGLDLSSSCLYGAFPANSSLFTLTHLQHLSLSDNHFNGSGIPLEIGQLNKLVSLNLSNSAFDGQIPLGISNMTMLSILDLSIQGITKAESQLELRDPSLDKLVHNLTSLSHLVLDLVDISSSVPYVLTNFTFLKELSLQYCELNGHFPTEIFHLPHLELLHLTGNRDIMGFLPEFEQNSPLRELALPLTLFQGELPSSIGQLANLEELILFDCHFSGPIPSSLGNLTKLTTLELSANAFSGGIPSSLSNLTQLEALGLSDINGDPERMNSWLSNLHNLTTLQLIFVNLSGEIPSAIANISSLTYLDLPGNQLTGEIPPLLMNLTHLTTLSLWGNQLEGPIFPQGISQMTNLNTLMLSDNRNLHGILDVFLELNSLRYLDLGGVKLTSLGKNPSNQSVAKLVDLELPSCNLPEFPPSLHTQDELETLDLSDNKIHGFIPEWFVNVTQESLLSLDLSSNFLTGFEQPAMVLPWNRLKILHLEWNRMQGSLPAPPISMAIYQVSSNHFTGGIPHQTCQAMSMSYFDISNNSLSGQIPNCLSELSSSLLLMNLKGNKFHGTIPSSYPNSCKLKMINLSENQLKGRLPRSLANCVDLEVFDVGRNYVNDTFPSWVGGLPKLHILVLRHNHFHGTLTSRPKWGLDFRYLRIIDLSNNFHTGDLSLAYLQYWDAMKPSDESRSTTSGTTFHFYIDMPGGVAVETAYYDYTISITNKGNDMQYTRVLSVFRVIDFSSNNFTGRIPYVMGELMGIQALNLSNNNLQGEIPSSLANMTNLESLDLSHNRLSGEIPEGLAQLTFLEVFNVSYNLLKGPIPQGRQFWTFDNSSFVGNSGLCGAPLSNKCGDAFQPPTPPSVDMENNDDTDTDSKLVDWIVRCLGCISGFVVGYVLGKYLTDKNDEWFVETFGRRRKGQRAMRRRAAARPRN